MLQKMLKIHIYKDFDLKNVVTHYAPLTLRMFFFITTLPITKTKADP